jgi:crotonobetainyl-CoA:carnitine CoA-transferase CaiB-like acyl-CoA transferase
VIGHATDLVEHPELVAQRLVRYARLVGRENVQAGTDCGIGSRVGHAEIVWAKLQALAEGARLASKELLRELFLTRTAAAWEELGNKAGAATGFVRTTTEWIHTEHAQRIGAVVQMDDPELGLTWMAGLPVHLTTSPGAPQGPRHLPDADHVQFSRTFPGSATLQRGF